MFTRDLRATINSDDLAYFAGYINDNLVAVSDAFGLAKGDVVRLAKNSFEAAFVDATQIEL